MEKSNIKNFKPDESDRISEIKFMQNNTLLHIVWIVKNVPHYIDMNLANHRIEMKKGEIFEDKSIFKYGLSYVQYHDSLNKFIQ